MLSFWLREAGIDRTTIGHLSWIGLAYSVKWLWSPLVDRLSLPLLTGLLGRRRAWLLLSQIVIASALVGMAMTDPVMNLQHLVFFALAVAFASATQDIALDAYRIEAVALNCKARWRPLIKPVIATRDSGFRRSIVDCARSMSAPMRRSCAVALAYLIMAASMAVGIVTTLIIREPDALQPYCFRNEKNRATPGHIGSCPFALKHCWFGYTAH